ncbi:MAG: roadblock/LC7 domain-containing protein [Verrucomicrobiota bacterium]|nr:roadblock/LC7 domain-containing protein [Verrucomicrobiota bacterium]
MTIQAVNEEQSKAIGVVLSDFMVLSEAGAVFLSDNGGNLIAYATATEPADDTIYTIAALAAGSFCATRELASLIKEPAFHSIYHQGDRASIYMRSIGPHYLILVIFGRNTPVGLVRLCADRAAQDLNPLIRQIDALGGPIAVTGNILELSGKDAFRRRSNA